MDVYIGQEISNLHKELFNTVFEMKLRIILLMSNDINKFFSLDRILALDFIACYGKEFDISDCNLHGDNCYMRGEFANRRYLAYEAIKELLATGYIDIKLENGYKYHITVSGKETASQFLSSYAKQYLSTAKQAIDKYCKYDDNDLLKITQM